MGGWIDMDMDRWQIQNSFRLTEIFKGDLCICSLQSVEIWLYNGVGCWAHLLGDWHLYQGSDDASDNPRCGEHRAQVRCIMICTFYPVYLLLQNLCKGGGWDVDNLRQYAISSKLFLTAVIQPFTPVIDIMWVRWRVSKQKEMTGIWVPWFTFKLKEGVFVPSSCSLPPSLLFLAPVFHVCQVWRLRQVQHLQIVLEPGFTVGSRREVCIYLCTCRINVGLLQGC